MAAASKAGADKAAERDVTDSSAGADKQSEGEYCLIVVYCMFCCMKIWLIILQRNVFKI